MNSSTEDFDPHTQLSPSHDAHDDADRDVDVEASGAASLVDESIHASDEAADDNQHRDREPEDGGPDILRPDALRPQDYRPDAQDEPTD